MSNSKRLPANMMMMNCCQFHYEHGSSKYPCYLSDVKMSRVTALTKYLHTDFGSCINSLDL